MPPKMPWKMLSSQVATPQTSAAMAPPMAMTEPTAKIICQLVPFLNTSPISAMGSPSTWIRQSRQITKPMNRFWPMLLRNRYTPDSLGRSIRMNG